MRKGEKRKETIWNSASYRKPGGTPERTRGRSVREGTGEPPALQALASHLGDCQGRLTTPDTAGPSEGEPHKEGIVP